MARARRRPRLIALSLALGALAALVGPAAFAHDGDNEHADGHVGHHKDNVYADDAPEPTISFTVGGTLRTTSATPKLSGLAVPLAWGGAQVIVTVSGVADDGTQYSGVACPTSSSPDHGRWSCTVAQELKTGSYTATATQSVDFGRKTVHHREDQDPAGDPRARAA